MITFFVVGGAWLVLSAALSRRAARAENAAVRRARMDDLWRVELLCAAAFTICSWLTADAGVQMLVWLAAGAIVWAAGTFAVRTENETETSRG